MVNTSIIGESDEKTRILFFEDYLSIHFVFHSPAHWIDSLIPPLN
jgi:hypothetical protein